ncbi:hypothetical protein BFJ72_g15065 [Fusarium proliferatum]|uniref:Uncharacterized protein n=1 Tax=Gibberella intermedia TaxID=948311 RepID=A0A420RTP0_GIBIN|nr:hypothetical protein FPRO03_14244 [Fusarium proliferatum]RKL20429.1 hypothetical protein BFJ72_g15065 [Fusarium proliferatum]
MSLATEKLVGVNGAVVTNPMKLSAKSHTDIAREAGDPKLPPHQFSSPLFKYVLPTSSFRSARATIRARNGYPLDWDQAGFALVWPTAELPDPDADHPGDANTAPLYVKTGVETFQGKTWGSTVANKREVDWSLYPLSEGQDTQSVTIEVVKYGERLITMLLRKTDDGQEVKDITRAIPWCFAKDEKLEVLWVCIYASRPDWDNVLRENLEVEIEEFQVIDENGKIKLI